MYSIAVSVQVGGKDLVGRVLQHEIDHLDGVTLAQSGYNYKR